MSSATDLTPPRVASGNGSSVSVAEADILSLLDRAQAALPASDHSDPSGESRPASPAGADPLAAFAVLRQVLAEHQAAAAEEEVWGRLLVARRAAAAAIAALPKRGAPAELVAAACDAVRELSASGVHDLPAEAEDLRLADLHATAGWPGVLAAALLVPAWQWDGAPALETLPEGLWGSYAAWLFAPLQRFTAPGQTARYAAHNLRRAEELARWVGRNRGSAAVAAALAAYLKTVSDVPLYFHDGNLRRHSELRGQILTRALALRPYLQEIPPAPRAGRRLRVGFVNRHFGPQTETYTTLPTFEHLDPARFEVVLFYLYPSDSALARHCLSRAAESYRLPKDLEAQLALLRASGLDAVVFGTNVTGTINEITRLALHRVAPLQVVNNSSCITTGLPEIDLYVSGTLTETADAPAQFTERLALLPGPAHAFNYEADRQEPTTTWTRAALGLPEEAVVFASAANYFKIIPEMQHAWARLLAAVPGSRLLVHPFNPNWSSRYPIERFCAEFDRVLAEHGVARERLIVSTVKFPSRTDVKELLRLGDLYLDSYPFGGVNSLVDPLEIGTPVVAWEGDAFRSRMGAALLRSLGLDELVATDGEEYARIALELAADPARRVRVSATIRARMERLPLFLDTLAASDAFGDLLETAYDELCARGRKKFRGTRTPLRAAPEESAVETTLAAARAALGEGDLPAASAHARAALRIDAAQPEARHLLGRALLAEGDARRATAYLLAAVQHREGDAGLWFDLSRALRATRQMPQAIETLEASLRLDGTNIDGWLMLAELASAVRATDLVEEVARALQRLAPDDPRVGQLIERTGIAALAP